MFVNNSNILFFSHTSKRVNQLIVIFLYTNIVSKFEKWLKEKLL